MVSTFTLVTRSHASVEQLFDLSRDIDAHMSSMSRSGERAIAGVTEGQINLGESVTWRARHFGVRFTMTSRITELDRPHRFVDEQIAGPFRVFRHEHRFDHDGTAAVMVDTLTVGAPVFGRLMERSILVPYLRHLIRVRNQHLVSVLGSVPGTDPQAEHWVAESTPFSRYERTSLVGHGDECWQRAARDVMRWAVKARSGFRVDDPCAVVPGERVTIRARMLRCSVREPVEVVQVVETPTRVGFSYRTLPGHPVSGEEAFVVHRRGEAVLLTIRSLTAPAAHLPWRALYPALRLAQFVARRRYHRALR